MEPSFSKLTRFCTPTMLGRSTSRRPMLAQPTTQTRDTDTGSPSSKKPTPPKEWIRRWKACARDVMRPRRNTKTFSTHHRTATPPTNYELRNDRYCNRARSILDSAKEKTSAATTLIKDATPAQLAVLVEELPAYMTAHSQPTSLITSRLPLFFPSSRQPNRTGLGQPRSADPGTERYLCAPRVRSGKGGLGVGRPLQATLPRRQHIQVRP
jgi:hypothetical protein